MKFTDVIPQGFSTAQVARLSGLSTRQIDHWDRQGFLKPSIRSAKGYGSARRYSFADVVRLRVAARLRAAGVGLARIRRCAEALERLGGEAGTAGDLGGVRLLVAGSRVLWARSDEELVDLLKEGQLVLVFSIGDAVAETAGAVARMTRENARDEGTILEKRGKQVF
ncbi:MAG: MerR family transcriptional regulator [Acidobacteriota bacterium]|nr:MerR family transcriptional regulator [Acidobacteriota bacterium]MDQ5871474.1 MerR family transcriptional regulator [Acidobacteriota bacterium]